jgi:hypothetical protein
MVEVAAAESGIAESVYAWQKNLTLALSQGARASEF